jgi:hypothetical protein
MPFDKNLCNNHHQINGVSASTSAGGTQHDAENNEDGQTNRHDSTSNTQRHLQQVQERIQPQVLEGNVVLIRHVANRRHAPRDGLDRKSNIVDIIQQALDILSEEEEEEEEFDWFPDAYCPFKDHRHHCDFDNHKDGDHDAGGPAPLQ